MQEFKIGRYCNSTFDLSEVAAALEDLQKYIETLEKENEECKEQILNLEIENENLKNRISELEESING